MVVVYTDLLGRGQGVVERAFYDTAKLIFGVPARLIYAKVGMVAVYGVPHPYHALDVDIYARRVILEAGVDVGFHQQLIPLQL
jgi:hypothetical protein